MAITLQETLRAVFYAPFYIALARGAYAQEGVEVRFVSAPTPGAAARGLFDGTVDVCWGGPMRVMQTHDRDPASDLVCFSEVVTRDPFFLLGRGPAPNFAVRDLANKRVGVVSEVPTPWLCLQHDLRLAGIDPARLDIVADRSMAENAAALLRGELDVVQLFQPYAEELLEAGEISGTPGEPRPHRLYLFLRARRDAAHTSGRTRRDGARDLSNAKVRCRRDRRGDGGIDRALLSRGSRRAIGACVQPLPGSAHLGPRSDIVARGLRPAARKPTLGRLRAQR